MRKNTVESIASHAPTPQKQHILAANPWLAAVELSSMGETKRSRLDRRSWNYLEVQPSVLALMSLAKVHAALLDHGL